MSPCLPRSSTLRSLLWVGMLAAVLMGAAGPAFAYDEATQAYFPQLVPPRSLLVAKTWSNNQEPPLALNANYRAARAELILLQSLSGILLKQGCREGLFIESNADHRFILHDLAQRRGLTFSYVSAPKTAWDLAARFQTNFGGRYVRCNISTNPDSLNVARMAAYQFNAVIVDSLIEATAISRGWTQAFDASDKNDQWFFTNWWPAWPVKGFAVEQNNDPALAEDYSFLNDYTPATGAPTFFDGTNTPLRRAFLQGLETDSVLVGWPHSDELTFTEVNSQNDVSLAAANWSPNLGVLASLRDTNRWPLTQALCPRGLPMETNVHFATFIFTDGDNLQWMHNNFLLNTQWWGSPIRSQIPLGWGISPLLRDLSPTIAEYLVENAAASRPTRSALVAMSPIGYCYPSLMSAGARATNALRLGHYLHDLDLKQLVILDKYGFETPAAYLPYVQQSQIEAIFYWDAFGNYARYAGGIQWQNGKPIISAFTNLWGASGPAEVAAALNARPRNPRSLGGYSLIDVHAWTHGVESVRQCLQLLDPQVRVVTPDVFVSLLRRSVGPEAWTPLAEIDRGDWQRAAYGPPSSAAMTISTNRTDQSVDGSPSTRVRIGPAYAFSNLVLPTALNVEPARTLLEFDLRGDRSGARVRFELWSDTYGAFLYVDVTLNFSGWRHFAYRLDGTDGLQVWNATPGQVATSISIWQVSGPWNSQPATFHLDNVRLTSESSQAARPSLFLAREGPQVRAAWSSEFSDFQLQITEALSGPWAPLPLAVVNTNCECSVRFSPASSPRFFRLARP